MRIDIITALPKLLESPFADSILKRAIDSKLVKVHIHDLRDYGSGKHRQIDDYQFGGGAGMVMMIEPIETIITKLCDERKYDDVIFMTPDGKRFDQGMANTLSLKQNIIILCGHYKGIDQRIREQYITSEISIGDYVLSGGELGAAVISDAIIRLIPGVLNDETSALSDSFQDDLLAPPVTPDQPSTKAGKCLQYCFLGTSKPSTNGVKQRQKSAQKSADQIFGIKKQQVTNNY